MAGLVVKKWLLMGILRAMGEKTTELKWMLSIMIIEMDSEELFFIVFLSLESLG